jgi:hypothetical protein
VALALATLWRQQQRGGRTRSAQADDGHAAPREGRRRAGLRLHQRGAAAQVRRARRDRQQQRVLRLLARRGGGGGGGQSESKDNGGGETKNGDGTTIPSGTSGTSSNVSELIEHLIPYIQQAANVKDVAWAPPGGWICQQCDQVNLRVGTFGNERCTKCQTLKRYLMEEILERDTWELSDFLSSKGIRAPNAFPTVSRYNCFCCFCCFCIVYYYYIFKD